MKETDGSFKLKENSNMSEKEHIHTHNSEHSHEAGHTHPHETEHTHEHGHTHPHDSVHHHNHSHTHDPQEVRAIVNRLKRSIGHLDKVRRMVEDGEDCSDVLIQLAAVRGQLDSICSIIMAQYTEKFAEEYRRTGNEVLIEQFKTELVRAIRK